MPKIGEISIAHKIGYIGSSKFIWSACIECGRERWVQCIRGRGVSQRCRFCCNSGSKSPHWKGGKRVSSYGYKMIRVPRDSFFYPMTFCDGYTFEHRLSMAQHLGRCLHSWEIIHHKNHIKNDNRIENLQLIGDYKHKQLTILETQISRLKRQNQKLKDEIRELKYARKKWRQVAH